MSIYGASLGSILWIISFQRRIILVIIEEISDQHARHVEPVFHGKVGVDSHTLFAIDGDVMYYPCALIRRLRIVRSQDAVVKFGNVTAPRFLRIFLRAVRGSCDRAKKRGSDAYEKCQNSE